MNWKDHEPVLVKGEAKIEALPIEPSVKDILDKVLEQNKMILEQNARIIAEALNKYEKHFGKIKLVEVKP